MSENPIDLEIVSPSVIASLERAAIDSQIATAHAFPRSLDKFKKRALDMACLDAETAESCIYIRPIGKKDGVQQFAEGASIRMAEIVAASYGNLRVASRIVEQTPRFVKCEGVAHDLETNYAGKCENMEPTVKASGEPYSESMRAVVAKAALSKAYRDAVFKVVPKALCKSIIDAAKKIAAGDGKPLEERRAKAQAWVGSLKGSNGRKLDEKRVFAAIGVSGWDDVGEEKLVLLLGLKTSMNDGEVTVDDAFPLNDTPEKPNFSKKEEKPAKAKIVETAAAELWAWIESKGITEKAALAWLEISKRDELTDAMAAKVDRNAMDADITPN